jgi:adenosine deaminase
MITNVSLNDEYSLLQENFYWSEVEFLACNQAALEAAFIEEPIKKGLMSQLLAN